MAKYIVFGEKKELPKETISKIRQEGEMLLKAGDEILDQKVKQQLQEEDNLVHVEGRIVVKLDIKNKDSHAFESGLTIRRERKYNEFNRRITEPVNCEVISGEGIPKGSELLVDHNAFHETNRINDYKNSFEYEESDRVRYFSIPYYEAFCWRVGGEDWHPLPPFEFALRVFEPYKGILEGIEPTKIKDTLYVLTGELKDKVVKTVIGSDYEIIYQELTGREGHLICFRPFGEQKRNMEEEAIAILWDKTEQVNNGELLIGFSISDAKPLQINTYAR